MGFQVGTLIGDEGIAGGVRFIEAITGKSLNLIENGSGDPGIDFTFPAAVEKFFFLLGHQFRLFLAHRLAKNIGFAHRVSGEGIGDLKHLFLKDYHTICVFQDFFQTGMLESNLLFAVFSFDININHAGIERSRTIKGIHNGQVGEIFRFELAQIIAHAARFKLEDSNGFAACEQFVHFFFIEVDGVDVDFFIVVLVDHLQAILDDSQSAKPEEIHFQQADFLDHFHVELSRDFVFIALKQGDIVG